MNAMDDLSWYLGCPFERDNMESVVKMTQTSFVDSLGDRLIHSKRPRLPRHQ